MSQSMLRCILRQHRILRNLRKNKGIIVTKPNTSSMKTRPWKRKLYYSVFYVNWNKKNFFNENEYDKLYPSGSARIYGTPRMHKFSASDSFSKLRPIVSSIGTFNYNLARFLCNLFSLLLPNDYSCKDTFFLFLKLRMQIFPENFLFPTM